MLNDDDACFLFRYGGLSANRKRTHPGLSPEPYTLTRPVQTLPPIPETSDSSVGSVTVDDPISSRLHAMTWPEQSTPECRYLRPFVFNSLHGC